MDNNALAATTEYGGSVIIWGNNLTGFSYLRAIDTKIVMKIIPLNSPRYQFRNGR
jgi:hypothetical protein